MFRSLTITSALAFLLVAGPIRSEAETIGLGDGSGWSQHGGVWTENEEGIIRPENVPNLHSRAFHTKKTYSDLVLEFEYNGDYRETGTGNAGVAIRAADPNHFYYIHFPWGGQQLRAKHFWAMIAKVEGDAYQRNIAAEWIPGVPSETDRWYKVKVVARGPKIEVWVDGRHALSVEDDTYTEGRIGLVGYGWYAFRNIEVTGTETAAGDWDSDAKIPVHSAPLPEALPGDQMPSGTLTPDGEVILAGGNTLIRSKDKGRTWEPAETLPEKLGVITDYGSSIFHSSDGVMRAMIYKPQTESKKEVPDILMAESADSGRTWTDPATAEVTAGWPTLPASLVPYGPVFENSDGVYLRCLLGGAKEANAVYTDVRSWGAVHAKAYIVRSEDQGKTWSAPIEMDRPSWVGIPRGDLPGALDFTEPTGVVIGDTVTVLIRPVYSPYMWQCWSYDGGASWDAAVRATFPGYAQSMVRTQSGAILCAHRYPQYSVNVSRDDGIYWDDGTIIDYTAWAMGCLLEVEPDRVLAVYMNAQRNMPLLAQRLRVEKDRIVPE